MLKRHMVVSMSEWISPQMFVLGLHTFLLRITKIVTYLWQSLCCATGRREYSIAAITCLR